MGMFDEADRDYVRNPSRQISFCRLASLLWILAIFLEYGHSPVTLKAELQRLQMRLLKHGLDRSGSTVMLCELLLKKEEYLEVHHRSYPVVRIMNVVKAWNIRQQGDLARLLYGYLANFYSPDAERLHRERVVAIIWLHCMGKS
jgi:hypothetical protein